MVRTALLGARDAADIGVPAVPLGDLHGEAGVRLLGRLGATVRLGAKVAAVRAAARRRLRRGTGRPGRPGARGGRCRRPASCSPCRPGPAARLLPADAALGQAGPGSWSELGASPIVNVHVIYDRQVTRLPFAAAVDSPVQWVFDRTGPSGLAAGQYLAVSLSAADDYGRHSRRDAAGAVRARAGGALPCGTRGADH